MLAVIFFISFIFLGLYCSILFIILGLHFTPINLNELFFDIECLKVFFFLPSSFLFPPKYCRVFWPTWYMHIWTDFISLSLGFRIFDAREVIGLFWYLFFVSQKLLSVLVKLVCVHIWTNLIVYHWVFRIFDARVIDI